MEQYSGVIAAFINSVLVLGIVQLLKTYVPKLHSKFPWLIPIIAGAIGPAVAAGQNYLTTLLGVPIDLNPIAAIFSGATAVAIHQVGKQVSKEAAKQVAIILMIGALGFSLVGCAGLQAQWQKATPEEKARIIVNEFQITLDAAFDAGKAYVTLHPEKKEDWQKKVIPLFNLANKSIRDYLAIVSEPMTVEKAIARIQPRVGEVLAILTVWGVVVEKK